MAQTDDPRLLAARRSFGYGRWDAPFWFVGAEPGGDDQPIWYETWLRLGGSELCGCREHHLGANFPKWHQGPGRATQSTWRRLIQLLFGYLGRPGDPASVLEYQRTRWGAVDGETAVLELSAIRAASSNVLVERTVFRDERIRILRERLTQHEPRFVVFYGRKQQSDYERIAGGWFGPDGTIWHERTLCVLVSHPVAPHRHKGVTIPEWWMAKGRELKGLVAPGMADGRPSNFSAPQPLLRPPARSRATDAGSKARQPAGPMPSDVIRLLVNANPKAPGSKSSKRFDCYTDGMTVDDYRDAVRHRLGGNEVRRCGQDLQFDSSRDFIAVERDGHRIQIPVSRSMRRP